MRGGQEDCGKPEGEPREGIVKGGLLGQSKDQQEAALNSSKLPPASQPIAQRVSIGRTSPAAHPKGQIRSTQANGWRQPGGSDRGGRKAGEGAAIEERSQERG